MKTKNKKFISLKEAARISGYSPDYIGYLIREGKIEGKPVYTNIAWQTTAEEVLGYKRQKKERKKEEIKDFKVKSRLGQRILREFRILNLFLRTFRFALPLIIVLILSFALLLGFILSIGFGRGYDLQPQTQQEGETQQQLRY